MESDLCPFFLLLSLLLLLLVSLLLKAVPVLHRILLVLWQMSSRSHKMRYSSNLLAILHHWNKYLTSLFSGPTRVSDSWLGCEFDPRLRRLFFMAYFRLSPLQKHVRKVVGGFGKKSCVSTGVRKPGNTHRHDMTLAVKVAFNPNTTNQPVPFLWIWRIYSFLWRIDSHDHLAHN